MAVPLSLGPVHHLRLPVTDVERSKAFYTELLLAIEALMRRAGLGHALLLRHRTPSHQPSASSPGRGSRPRSASSASRASSQAA